MMVQLANYYGQQFPANFFETLRKFFICFFLWHLQEWILFYQSVQEYCLHGYFHQIDWSFFQSYALINKHTEILAKTLGYLPQFVIPVFLLTNTSINKSSPKREKTFAILFTVSSKQIIFTTSRCRHKRKKKDP